jgi:hypothetical protein
MTIQSYTMGPGSLSLGTDPSDLDVSCQVKAFKVECAENVKKTDPTPMLCGEDKTTADRVTREWKVTGKILQDLAAAGVVDYTWTNAGDTVAFVFIPSTAKGRKVTGVCRLVPLTVGGDAGTDPDSDLSWTAGGAYDADAGISGDPVLAAVV